MPSVREDLLRTGFQVGTFGLLAIVGQVSGHRQRGIAAYRGTIESTLLDGLPPEPAAAASDSIDGALVSAGELPEHSASN